MATKPIMYQSGRRMVRVDNPAMETKVTDGLKCAFRSTLDYNYTKIEMIWEFDWKDLKDVDSLSGHIILKSPSDFSFKPFDIRVNLSETNKIVQETMQTISYADHHFFTFEYSLTPHFK